MYVDGNVYLNGAEHFIDEKNFIESDFNPGITILEEDSNILLNILFDKSISKVKTQLVTTGLLGKAMIPNQAYENFDGSPLEIDIDYFGKKRNKRNPSAGPFEKPEIGKPLRLKVW